MIRRFSTQPRPIADCRPAEVQSERIAKTWRNGGEATTIGIGRHICVVCDKTACLCGALWATTIHGGTGKTTRIWQADATGRVPPMRTRRGASLPCGRAGARPSRVVAQERVPPVWTRRSASLPCGRDGACPSHADAQERVPPSWSGTASDAYCKAAPQRRLPDKLHRHVVNRHHAGLSRFQRMHGPLEHKHLASVNDHA